MTVGDLITAMVGLVMGVSFVLVMKGHYRGRRNKISRVFKEKPSSIAFRVFKIPYVDRYGLQCVITYPDNEVKVFYFDVPRNGRNIRQDEKYIDLYWSIDKYDAASGNTADAFSDVLRNEVGRFTYRLHGVVDELIVREETIKLSDTESDAEDDLMKLGRKLIEERVPITIEPFNYDDPSKEKLQKT